jgi:hypothetical protein
LELELTQHSSLDRLKTREKNYIGTRTDKTQQPGQTLDERKDFIGTRTDTTQQPGQTQDERK